MMVRIQSFLQEERILQSHGRWLTGHDYQHETDVCLPAGSAVEQPCERPRQITELGLMRVLGTGDTHPDRTRNGHTPQIKRFNFRPDTSTHP